MASYGGYSNRSSIAEKQSERSRWTPLTRMLLSGEMTQERQKELTAREKIDRWMINEGYRRM
jgi:NADPH oxidase